MTSELFSEQTQSSLAAGQAASLSTTSAEVWLPKTGLQNSENEQSTPLSSGWQAPYDKGADTPLLHSTENNQRIESSSPWRASPYDKGADTPLLHNSENKQTIESSSPWRASPYYKGVDSPLLAQPPQGGGTGGSEDPNQNGSQSSHLVWRPKNTAGWNGPPNGAPGSDNGIASETQSNIVNPVDPTGRFGQNAYDSLRPRYGFDGSYGEGVYLVAGGVGGVLGKYVGGAVVNRFAPQTSVAAGGRASLLNNSFVKGAAFAGLTMIADDYLDRCVFKNNHQQGVSGSFYLNSLTIPIALAAGKGWRSSLTTLAAGTAIGVGLEYFLPASEKRQVSKILAPTGIEALTMGAAYMLPVADTKTRMLIIAGTWLANRALNFLGAAGSKDYTGIYKDAHSAMTKDASERSASSLNDAIDKYRDLGKDKEIVLRYDYETYLNRPSESISDKLTAYRGAVTLGTAFGESRLSHGTLIEGEKPAYILQDKDLDLDAKALRGLLIAEQNIENVKAEVKSRTGQESAGTLIKDMEAQQLEEVSSRVQNDIDKIYGKHDLTAATSELAKYYKSDQHGFGMIQADLEAQIALNVGSKQTAYMAKLFRDHALMNIAFAEFTCDRDPQTASIALNGSNQGRQTLDSSGRPRGYDGAIDAVKQAEAFDAGNADLPELKKLVTDLNIRLGKSVGNQLSNPIYNPLNLNGGRS